MKWVKLEREISDVQNTLKRKRMPFLKVFIPLFFLFQSATIFSQQSQIGTPKDSSFVAQYHSLKSQYSRLDSALNRIELENDYIKQLAERDLKNAENLLGTLEIIVEFIALLLAIFAILGVIEIRKINRTRNRLNEEIKRLSRERENALIEIKNIKDSFVKEGKELLQILFYITEGDNSIDSDRLEEAINMYQQALKIKEDNPEIYTKLGYVYVKKGEYSKAISYLEKGYKIAPQNVSLLNGLARAYRKAHQYEKAETFYRKAIEIDDEFIWALSGLGQILILKKDYDSAENIYHKILLKDTSYHPHINLAIVYACKGNREKSEFYFKEALSLTEARLVQSPTNMWAVAYKAISLVGLFKYDEARQLFLTIKEKGIFPPAILSITDRLRVLYDVYKEERIKRMIRLFDGEQR